MKSSGLLLLAFAARAYQSQSNPYIVPLPADLTIALVPYDGSCSIDDVPSIHITGIMNSTTVSVSTKIFWDPNYDLGPIATINYTASNSDKFSNSTWYTRLYYAQGGNSSAEGYDVIAPVFVNTFPCSNTATSCDDEGPPNATTHPGFASGPNRTANQFLGWDCYAEGACYDAGYDIKGLLLTGLNASASEGYQCLLGNATSGNDTIKAGAGSVITPDSSALVMWTTAVLLATVHMWL